MAKATVQSLVLQRLDRIEEKFDSIIPVLEGLKVKAAIAGGVAGIVGTGLVGLIFSYLK